MLLDFNKVLPVSASEPIDPTDPPRTMTIRGNAPDDYKKHGWWAGKTAAELQQIYKQLYSLGTLSQAHYIVELEPYDPAGPLSKIPLFNKVPVRLGRFDLTGAVLPWLATSCSISLIDAQSDSIQAGHHQQNFITGNGSNDVTITFLETEDARILRGFNAVRAVMFNKDGTQGLPAQYMMKLKISLFKRYNREARPFTKEWLVALQAASVDLAAQNKDALEVPLTFLKMYPML